MSKPGARSEAIPASHQRVLVRKPSLTQKLEAQLALIVHEARDQRLTGTYSLQLHCQDGSVADVTVLKEQVMRL
jgi:hypothetical protein